jgi:hypothetical protein
VTGEPQRDQEAELKAFAEDQGVSLESARLVLGWLRAQLEADRFYVFWTTGRGGEGRSAGRQRTLLAFLTPDAALTFAQRNQMARAAELPRLRRLTLLQLVQAVLREPAISALLIAKDLEDELIPAGQLPAGVRVERAELLRQLQERAPI